MREETYIRVIPRDFFNEAKLLKCMGVLSLRILDYQLPEGIKIEIEESGEPFNIELLDSGHLTVTNYPITVNGLYVTMMTNYNAKDNFPLVCFVDDEEYTVFNDNGTWNDEFLNRFRDDK